MKAVKTITLKVAIWVLDKLGKVLHCIGDLIGKAIKENADEIDC